MDKKKTILLVEDSRLIRERTTSALKKWGYDVIEVVDGLQAVEACRTRKSEIDAIICDLEMPNMDGYEFSKYNYENDFLPFIVYTSVADAKSALRLLEYGVHDYIEKPYREEQLSVVINNAINRWSIHKEFDRDSTMFPGNLAAITFPSRRVDLTHANSWVLEKIAKHFDGHECDRFMNFLDEILFNAHEHGNLGISESEKTRLIQEGTFEQEVERLENEIKAQIKVSVSILSREVAVSVSDQGKGFNYGKYLDMPEDEILERICLPNGRGICMAQRYFDSVDYQNNGSTVLLTKRFG